MNIAHIVCTYPPYYGGMGRVCFEMASGLERRGHTVEVFTPVVSELPEEHIEHARRVKPHFQLGNAAWMPTLHRELSAFDIVHLHYPFFGTANLVRRWKKNNPGKSLVITYHMDARAPGWKGLFFKLYSQFWMPRILSSADRITVSSFDYAEACQAHELFQTQKEKWMELPFGVDLERFAPRPRPLDLFNELELDADSETVLFVGGMDRAHYFKGVPVLLDALSILKKDGKPLQAVFVGDGELRIGFEQLARGMGIGNLCRFVGRVGDGDLPHYYNAADVFVLPSISQGEAFGMVLLEAMASGVPAIAFDIPGVRTIVRDLGIVVPPGNAQELAGAIGAFLETSPDDREAWSHRVRAAMEERYGWEGIVDRLEGVYKELAKGENRSI